MIGQTVAAHRLLLTAAEFDVLRAASPLPMPPGFDRRDPLLTGAARLAAVATLAARHVIDDQSEPPGTAPGTAGTAGTPGTADTLGSAGPAVHPSIAANLAVLARPRVLIRTDVSCPDGGLRAVHAVAGQLGASLFAAADGGAELSMFAATDLGRELARVVALPRQRGPQVAESLAGWDTERGGLSQRPYAVLRALVTGSREGNILAGQVIWVATGSGWLGARAVTGADGARRLSYEPVTAGDLGTWVAPYVAELLG